jgi:CRP/FNR family transcriptional regulator, cyclic AMP receptor protein
LRQSVSEDQRPGKRDGNFIIRNMKTQAKPKPESMATRVAFHPFLAGMNRTQLALLTDCAIAAHFAPGQIILREGEMANRFYLIESGKVVLESGEDFGEPVIVETIGAGDLLGWSWMFPPHVWHFTARAVERTEAIFFYGTILREYCERDPSLGYELFKRMAPIMLRRLQAAREKMLAIHAQTEALEPLVLESPFMGQEQDI